VFKQFFEGMAWAELPLFALGLFMVMFALVVVRTFVWKAKGDFESQSALPLSEGKVISSSEVAP
jgi:hypothetical protein